MTIVCGECGEEFSSRSELFKHVRASHGDEEKSTNAPTTPTTAASSTTRSGAANRRGPRKMFEEEASVDIIEPEKPVEKFDWDKLSAYLPLALSVFWITIGTVFYAVHDNLGWARALFMSVNVGWSINWPMDGLSEFDSPMSKFFTLYHTSIGVLFAGVTVLYMAQEVGKNKDNWILQIIKMKELDATAETEGCWDSFEGLIKVHFPTLRIIAVFLVWFTFGLLWFSFTNTEYTVAKNVDFVYSTLTTSGYVAPPSTIGAYQLIITALYTNFGVPLLSISLGLFVSLIMESPEDNLIFHQIIAPVTSEEISFMQEFCIEDGDGIVDSKEFIILSIVRIGAVSPELIRKINERFRILDRKHMGKIMYDDLVVSSEEEPPIVLLSQTPAAAAAAPASAGPRMRSQHHMTLSSKPSNNSLFRARAKNVFEASGSSAAAEIRANIAKIEALRKATNQSPTSSHSSGSSKRRLTVHALKTVLHSESDSSSSSSSSSSDENNDNDNDNNVSNDDDADTESASKTPSWRNPKRRASSVFVPSREGDVEEGGVRGRLVSSVSTRRKKSSDSSRKSSKKKRRGSSLSDRSNVAGSGRSNEDDGGGEEDDDEEEGGPRGWRNRNRHKRKSSGFSSGNGHSTNTSTKDGEDGVNGSSSTRSTSSIVSANFPIDCDSFKEVAARLNSCISVEEGDEEKEDAEVDDKSSHSATGMFYSDEDDNSLTTSQRLMSPLSSRSQQSSSRKIYPEPFYFPSEDEKDEEANCAKVLPFSNHSFASLTAGGDDSDVDCTDDEDKSHPPQISAKSKFRAIVKKQQLENMEIFSLPGDAVKKEVARDEGSASTKSKHHGKLQKAKEERRSSKRVAFKNRRKNRRVRMMLDIKKKMKSSYAITFYAWFMWLAVGTIFYCLEENLTFCKGFFVSTSVGYGIFWYDQTSTNDYAKVFLTFHFSVGVFGVACAMAIFAKSLVSSKKEWFVEAKQKRQLQDGQVTYFDYYWPKVYVHVFFWLWMLMGIIWGMTSIKWSVLDAWLFCMSTMATGGLVSLPSSGVHQLDYVFVSFYIIIGAPLMAISCGINARSISNYGRSSKVEMKLNAPVTEDELVMMKHLGIEDDDGYIDNAEYTLLMLVRIGALNADLISVLFDRYHEIDLQGTVTYDSLQKGGSFVGNAMLMPFSLKGSFKGSFKGTTKESTLLKKLRLDSMGG